ncbi:putative lipid scramblase CLPTM1 [Phlebotomus argentipes]|uniref:putative lipid scramblase CLPTM1 n=1 Tax=Phlebotomus argentipes TaxID=94469 RepID=UPI002892F134|nr:putative lipid scramblase CLPTM1 [Phlebotomus argentipes]
MAENEALVTNDASDAAATPAEGASGPAATQEGAQQRQPSRMESFFAITKSLIIRALVIYFISSFFRRPAAPATDPNAKPGAPAGPKTTAWNYFENGAMFDLYVYVSEDYNFADFHRSEFLVWQQMGLVYNDWTSGRDRDGVFTHSTQIPATERVQNNGSIYIHAYVVKSGQSPNPHDTDNYAGRHVSYSRRLLNKFKRIKHSKTHNLITGESTNPHSAEMDEQTVTEIVSHWHPNLTINLVTDQTNWVRGSVPAPFDEYITFLPGGHTYLPVLFFNDYWNMMRDYQPLNKTTKVLELHLTFQPLSLFKWQLYAAQAMKNKWTSGIFSELTEEQDEDQDSLKEALLDTSPLILGLTAAVSILHSVFEILAFKNDIQFWNNRKSLEGLSVRSVFFGVFQSVIVLLYVLDNDTNFMIRISCFIGLGIEVWKIQKVVNIHVNREALIFGFLPRITFSDKGSYVESSTKQYDKLAFKYLGWLCFPLLIGYSAYSLVYNEHKGWYSFVLNMLYGFLLTFGFIMMTPQLFINYKLKSVAHLPWRMMTYKFLNTFIDDIFAFVIKMPTMYRLGCFRDDIVFFVFLYQRWIYKVDVKRVNEFGFSGEMEQEAKMRMVPAEQQPPKPEEEKKKD